MTSGMIEKQSSFVIKKVREVLHVRDWSLNWFKQGGLSFLSDNVQAKKFGTNCCNKPTCRPAEARCQNCVLTVELSK
jgi:hypothetical protein